MKLCVWFGRGQQGIREGARVRREEGWRPTKHDNSAPQHEPSIHKNNTHNTHKHNTQHTCPTRRAHLHHAVLRPALPRAQHALDLRALEERRRLVVVRRHQARVQPEVVGDVVPDQQQHAHARLGARGEQRAERRARRGGGGRALEHRVDPDGPAGDEDKVARARQRLVDVVPFVDGCVSGGWKVVVDAPPPPQNQKCKRVPSNKHAHARASIRARSRHQHRTSTSARSRATRQRA